MSFVHEPTAKHSVANTCTLALGAVAGGSVECLEYLQSLGENFNEMDDVSNV